ncbi:MAG TPA: DMT family transporter [Thermoanaerobaculia bacterium]|nr:DMT family transporter [Thermoanaerobaculia bacterium]
MPRPAPRSSHVPGALGSRLRLLAAAALFSSGGAAIKSIHLTAWQVASFRSSVATLAFLLLMPETRRRPTPRVLCVGAVYAATMILFVQSNKLTTAASAIFLQATAPLWVVLLSPWLLGERVRLRDVVYMVVLAVGLGCFFLGIDPVSVTAPHPLLGNFLAALSGLTWALTIMGLRALGRGGDEGGSWGPASALWGSIFAALGCLPMALPVGPSTAQDWLIIVFLGVFQIAVAYVFLLRGIGQVPAVEASLLLLLEPVLNPVWAWIVHGERPGAWSLAGGAILLLATAGKTWIDARLPSPPVSRALSAR